jgi:hypothetical protein
VRQIRDLFAKAANKMRTTPDPPYEKPALVPAMLEGGEQSQAASSASRRR